MKQALTTAIKQITAWSFSRWRDYTQCPAAAKYKHVERRKEPDNPAGARGTLIHENADDYVSKKTNKLLPDFNKFKSRMVELRKLGASCEQEWAFDVNWQKVDWFAPTAWMRVKVDTHYLITDKGKRGRGTVTTVVVIDYKSGRQHDEHAEQRSLYALAALLVYPDAQHVLVQHWYVDSGEVTKDKYDAIDFEDWKQFWLQNTVPMMRDKLFAPRPGQYCRFCFFRKSNGGPCKF